MTERMTDRKSRALKTNEINVIQLHDRKTEKRR